MTPFPLGCGSFVPNETCKFIFSFFGKSVFQVGTKLTLGDMQDVILGMCPGLGIAARWIVWCFGCCEGYARDAVHWGRERHIATLFPECDVPKMGIK